MRTFDTGAERTQQAIAAIKKAWENFIMANWWYYEAYVWELDYEILAKNVV